MNSEKHQLNSSNSPFPVGAGAGQGSLNEQAWSVDFNQYSKTFGKYLSGKDDHKEFSEDEQQRKDRAKRANRIYKQVCEDVGLKACFFSNFGDWSEYVDGRMSDAEFQTIAASRARQMMEEN